MLKYKRNEKHDVHSRKQAGSTASNNVVNETPPAADSQNTLITASQGFPHLQGGVKIYPSNTSPAKKEA